MAAVCGLRNLPVASAAAWVALTLTSSDVGRYGVLLPRPDHVPAEVLFQRAVLLLLSSVCRCSPALTALFPFAFFVGLADANCLFARASAF